MPKLALYNQNGIQVGDMEVREDLFGAPVKETALYNTVRVQQARRRQGSASTKTRGKVRGGGSKPWVQKGTGRARHGSIRSPIWVGGGVVFGPHPRKYALSVPKKVRKTALCSALSAKARDGKILVVEQLSLDRPKTRVVADMLESLNITGSVLIVTAQPDRNIVLSVRNLPQVKAVVARQLNVLDIMSFNYLILTREALEQVEEVFGK